MNASTERLVVTNGVTLRLTEAGDRGAPVVVLAHGFPELKLAVATPSATIDVPTLFIGGTADPALMMTPRARVRDVVSGPHPEVLIEGAGHWLQQERPTEVNAALLDFLGSTTQLRGR